MNIDKQEVLRYLGYMNQSIEKELERLIDECIAETKQYAKAKSVVKVFELEKHQHHIGLLKSKLIFRGKDIIQHLKNAKVCAIMAVTLGNDIESKIRFYEKTNLTKAIILDACATTAVECFCDEVEEEVNKEAHKRKLGITHRYSPGYGDFSIDIQTSILNTLETQKKIGLTCTEEQILIPRKSVTAVIGFQDKDFMKKRLSCKSCSRYGDCIYKREGNDCGNKRYA
ncbi:vitamin B12 dependent-methionine synthase activation domain-containing protein [Clostridiaceae bacterium 35-E11]